MSAAPFREASSSICRLGTAAGSNDLQHLGEMEHAALNGDPLGEALVANEAGALAGLGDRGLQGGGG